MSKDSIQRAKKERSLTAPRILLYLAQNKGHSKWQIANELHKSYGNIHASVQKMLAYRIIKIEDTKPGARNKKIDVEYYDLTLDGLMLVLSDKENLDVLDKIAETQKTILPLIFGKWRFFEQNGVKPLIIERLQKVARDERYEFFALAQPEEKMDQDMLRALHLSASAVEKAHRIVCENADAIHQDRITKNVLLFSFNPLLLREVKAQQELLSMLKRDKELKTFVKKQYEQIKARYKFDLANIETFLETW